MNIENLKAFIQIVLRNSFASAARDLNITTAAISKRMSALEAELEMKLIQDLLASWV